MSAGDPPDGSHGPHVLVADVEYPQLDDDDRHHLERVLRLRPGDPLTVGDGAGRWRPCRLGAEPDPVGEVCMVARPAHSIGVAFALVKGGRPELVVQKLTELGIDTITPFVAERSVVRWDADKAVRNHGRLGRVAREAVMQCRRPWAPVVEPLAGFAELVERPGAALADGGGDAPNASVRTLLVGPEGGWTDGERAMAAHRVALGPTILRAETAAIAGGALLAALRSGLVGPVDAAWR